MDIRTSRNGGDRWVRYKEEGQGSPLYSAPRRNFNPSAAGGHIQEEVAEVTRWVNQYLSCGGYSSQLVTDLAEDMADGITLLRLVQAVANKPLPKHFPNPMLRIQKLENLRMCMQVLKHNGVTLTNMHAEDIASGNLKSILAICHALRHHFTGGSSPKNNGLSVSPHGGQHSSRLSVSSLDRDDMALLSWLGGVVHRDIPDYTVLYDGRILCELMNEVHRGAVFEEDISTKNPQERLKLAFAAGEQHLYITKGSVNIGNVASGREDARLKSYLHQCKLIYQQLSKERSEKGKTSVSREKKRSRSPSMEEVFESLRTSGNTGNLESREAAKVASRSYEGLKLKRVNAEGQRKPEHQLSDVRQTISAAPTRPPHRSTSQIPTHPAPPPPYPHFSKRPLSEIYVGGGGGGASSFSDLSTTQTDFRPTSKYERSQSKEDHGRFHSNQLGHTQYGLHLSMDSGMAAATSRNTATPTSSRNTPIGTIQSGYVSDSVTKPSSLGQGTSLPRSFSHSGLSAPIPTPPPSTTTLLNKSLTRSTESFNQPTFDLPGGRTAPRRAGSYARLDSMTADELSTQVADLQERVGALSLQLLFEKADLYKQLRRTLAKERKRRKTVEKKLAHLEKTAQQTVRHYDSCFIKLAKEVSALRAELGQTNGSGSQSPPKGVSMDTEATKQQQSTLTGKDSKSSHMPANPPKNTAKRSLFLRKRSNTMDSPATTSRGPFLQGSVSSFRKLSNFFGEEPPRLEDLESFLERLGYSHLTQNFTMNQITLAELQHMDDTHLERLGIPLGPRTRILSELKFMLPLDNFSAVI